ncbi:MAG: hypothetical protein U1E65_24125 [Myxococcota bacterium]
MRRLAPLACALWALLSPAGALAEGPSIEPPADEVKALTLATAAFEYRDFEQVIQILEPWVKPPRIVDPARRKEAHRLLGISFHIRGDVPRAEEEFAQLLLADPAHKLDPFVVPPAVIETMERVRERMRPVLDELTKNQRTAPPKKLPSLALSSPIFAYAPFGLSHFLALDEPGWGAVWLGVESAGLVANITGFVLASSLPRSCTPAKTCGAGLLPSDAAAYDRATATQFIGLGVFAAAWIASGVQGHLFWNARAAQLEQRVNSNNTAGALTLPFD